MPTVSRTGVKSNPVGDVVGSVVDSVVVDVYGTAASSITKLSIA